MKLSVRIGKLKLKNPVMVASGTFGYGREFESFVDLRGLGAIVTKTITLKPRKGNLPGRTCETPAGMLNSVGLENPGMEGFLKEKLPLLKKIGVPLVVSIASERNIEEFSVLVSRLDKIKKVSAIELNISCPNLKHVSADTKENNLISQSPKETKRLIKKLRRLTDKVLIAKLSPNVADISSIALAAEDAGADAISLINTLTGMAVDIEALRPKISSVTGGLSGPAIRPVAVRMVWEVFQRINIPIIGMGGIMDASSALEFFIAGARAVSIGTANFINPRVSVEIICGIKKYLREKGINDINKLVGSLKV